MAPYSILKRTSMNEAVGHGGALVESMPFDRRVTGSNAALTAMWGPWASPLLAVACSASACKLQHSGSCCGREPF